MSLCFDFIVLCAFLICADCICSCRRFRSLVSASVVSIQVTSKSIKHVNLEMFPNLISLNGLSVPAHLPPGAHTYFVAVAQLNQKGFRALCKSLRKYLRADCTGPTAACLPNCLQPAAKVYRSSPLSVSVP